MSEWRFKGYGRAWTEHKAAGFARLRQILREPATKNTYYLMALVLSVCTILLSLI